MLAKHGPHAVGFHLTGNEVLRGALQNHIEVIRPLPVFVLKDVKLNLQN